MEQPPKMTMNPSNTAPATHSAAAERGAASTTFLLRIGLRQQYKPPAIYILELHDIYFLYFARAFYISDVPNMRRRRRALNAAADRASRRTAGGLP
jgi:hypothetical protein